MRPLAGMAGLAAALLLAIAPAIAAADTIITTSRQTFTGRILEETLDKVVIKTDSGTVTVPRAAIAMMQKDLSAAPPAIVAEKVLPADAPKAFEEAKAAIAKANWVKAGSLLEGLLDLPAVSFPQENRMAATAALATCYLQIKDLKGGAKTFLRRVDLVLKEGDKRRLLATAEALDKAVGSMIGVRPVSTYEEAIAAAMDWKAAQLFADAKDLGTKAIGLNEMDKLEAAAKRCLDKASEADLYVPGFGTAHRKEVLAALADNILQAARKAVDVCTNDRKVISRFWRTSAADVKYATAWNDQVARYLAMRQAAEDGLKNLKPLAARFEVPDLATEREKETTPLLAQLDELAFHEMIPGMPERLRIALRRIGSPFNAPRQPHP